MSFEKHSNFNKSANFSEVKFGENKPVLEVELNELQQIQNEARADIIRDSIPSGFVTLGEIDYDYCKNNNNQIKLKSESIAYVHGYRIVIPKDTIIEIGESDKVRDDLVFLEVWKEEVTSDSTLTNQGGEGQKEITNSIKDSRYPVETSHRIALKWRIRHVANIDFSTYNDYGFCKLSDTSSYNTTVCPQGARTSLPTSDEIKKAISGYTGAFFRNLRYSNIQNASGKEQDNGLYIVGWNNKTNSSNHSAVKNFFKTFDGYIYAIPMFRLLRKPNVGLASPFEYKKIHNQLDPKKFAHLVGQENVEKVHTINVKGKTYKNLLGNGSITSTNNNEYVKEFVEPLNPQGTYTLFAWGKLISGANKVNFNFMGYDGASHTLNEMITPNETETNFMKRVVKLNYPTNYTVKWRDRVSVMSELVDVHYVLLEGDHTDTVLLEPFNYIKSLGELENNSITVENNLVEEGTYVHELQNHILPTHPEVTHVTWGEDVVIPPEVEIELKRGEEVIQTITQLPVKLETTGEEKLHVKTMKGQTLVNLCNASDRSETLTSSSRIFYCKIPYTIKANSVYTIFAKISNSTTSGPVNLQYAHSDGTYSYPKMMDASTNGVVKLNIVNAKDIVNILIYISDTDTGQVTVSDVMIIEGDYANVDIPYFTGMKSVEMASVKTIGKNLFDYTYWYPLILHNFDYTITGNKINTIIPSGQWFLETAMANFDNLKEDTIYTISATSVNSQITILFWKPDGTLIFEKGVRNTPITFTTPNEPFVVSVRFCRRLDSDNTVDVQASCENIQIEEGSTATPYEPYKSNILSTPEDIELRGIDDVRDELNLLTGELTKRVDTKKLKDITFTFQDSLESETTYLISFGDASHYIGGGVGSKILSNITTTGNIYYVCETEGIRYDGWGLYLRIKKDRITEKTYDAVKQYFESTDATIQYQNKTESIKTVDLTEDDYVGKSKVTYQLAEPLRKVGTYSDFIKGKTLYSNIGVEVLNGSEEWVRNGTDYGFYFNHPNSMPSTPLISPQLPTLNGWENYARKGIFRGSEAIGLVVSADDLSENTLQGFKNWLKANPVTIYYVKANPVEITLKEVSPLECDFSYYRQFDSKYKGYPNELPNGVKDVITGKDTIKRYTRQLRFDGTESWNALSTDGDVVRAFVNVATSENLKPKAVSEVLNSYKLPFGTSSITREEIGVDQNSNIVLSLAKSRLSSADLSGFKSYLGQNPIQVIFELNSPYPNTVTEDKCKPIPYMPLNSYVGSLYVADGINRTKFLTAFSPSEYEVQTYHRYFSNEFNVFEDTTLKKSPYGHKTYLEEVEGKYVEKFIAGLEKHEIEDLRHKVSLTGFDYSQLLQDSFLKLIKGELS